MGTYFLCLLPHCWAYTLGEEKMLEDISKSQAAELVVTVFMPGSLCRSDENWHFSGMKSRICVPTDTCWEWELCHLALEPSKLKDDFMILSLASCIFLNPLTFLSCKPQREAYFCINAPNLFNALGESMKILFNSAFFKDCEWVSNNEREIISFLTIPKSISRSYLLTSPSRSQGCLN